MSGTPAEKAPTRGALLNASYSKATQWLIEQHRDEFNKKRQEILAADGVVWEPPLTEAQKQEQALAALLAERPDLIDKVVGMAAGSVKASSE